MSRGARWLLGAAMLVIAAGFAAIPLMRPAPNFRPSFVTLAFVGFPTLIAVACFFPAGRPVTLRLIAATVLALSFGYVAIQVAAFPLGRGNRGAGRTQPSLQNSLMFLATFGLPSVYVLVRGRYPGWGRHAAAFGPNPVEETGR